MAVITMHLFTKLLMKLLTLNYGHLMLFFYLFIYLLLVFKLEQNGDIQEEGN